MTTAKEACGNGHPMTAENTYLRRGTQAVCRACAVMYTQAYRARRKAAEARGEDWSQHKNLGTRERLMSRIVELPDGCWRWTGFVNDSGYGVTSYEGRRGTPAHQAFYQLFIGTIPAGRVLDHLCHTRDLTCDGGTRCPHRRCVNPEHLEPVTSEENSSRGVHGRKERCPHGHAYDQANTYVNGGRRFCRACMRDRSAAYKARKAAAA